MRTCHIFGKTLAAGFVACFLTTWSSAPADAGSCDGTVGGLSSTYNKERGTGFLAVRARPTTRSKMKDELFNGDTVELYSRKGKWYEVSGPSGISGWAHRNWIRTDCDPNNP